MEKQLPLYSTTSRYDKIDLAISERGNFVPGNELCVFPTRIGSQDTVLAAQMCREIRHPEQWADLGRKGVSIFAFFNMVWVTGASHLSGEAIL